MWTLLSRFRSYPNKELHDVWQQHFVDHLFYDAEEKMWRDYNVPETPHLPLKLRSPTNLPFASLLLGQLQGPPVQISQGLVSDLPWHGCRL